MRWIIRIQYIAIIIILLTRMSPVTAHVPVTAPPTPTSKYTLYLCSQKAPKISKTGNVSSIDIAIYVDHTQGKTQINAANQIYSEHVTRSTKGDEIRWDYGNTTGVEFSFVVKPLPTIVNTPAQFYHAIWYDFTESPNERKPDAELICLRGEL